MSETVSAEARLRARNQLTNPGPIVRPRDRAGEKFVVELEPDDQDTILLRVFEQLRGFSARSLGTGYQDLPRGRNARPGAKHEQVLP